MSESTTCTESPAETRTAGRAADLHRSEPRWSAARTKEGVDLRVELPGVKKEDLRLEVIHRELRLEADRAEDRGEARLIHGSPVPGGYRLKLRLAENLDGPALSARLENGVLAVSLPLVEAAQPRTIEVH